jgi:putative hemolysin
MHDQATIPRHAAIAPPAERGALSAETAALSGNLLARQNSYAAYLATAGQIPHLLREIGRQREIAFRAVGEGTGRVLDLDRFDQHYLHLFVWDHQQEQLAGAYRISPTLTVLAEHGPEGLYTTTLLEFSQEFPAALTPGLELGRSFVVPAYQRSPLPLALLWRGTGVWLRQHPQCVRLFGAVSISGDYSVLSRGLLVEFLSRRPAAGSLPGGIRPRHPPGPALTVPTGPEAWAGPAGL